MNTKKYLLKHPDAHTAYIGWKISGGEIVKDEFGKPVKAIVFAVEKKKPIEELDNPIPKSYGTMLTDVVEKPRMLASPPLPKKNANDLQQRIRPIRGGISIGHVDVTAGTLGCIVKKSEVVENPPGSIGWWDRLLNWLRKIFGFDAKLFSLELREVPLIMSNNHVLACENAAKIGDPIIQPGYYDNGKNPKDIVAYLDSFTVILPDKPNKMDVAFATIADDADWDFGIEDIPVINDEIRDAELGDIVQKTGRTTAYTMGKVIGVDATSWVGYDFGDAFFEDQILIQDMAGHFSNGGDSGSVILDMDGHPVGLLFAGGGNVTLANKMSTIADEHGIEFY